MDCPPCSSGARKPRRTVWQGVSHVASKFVERMLPCAILVPTLPLFVNAAERCERFTKASQSIYSGTDRDDIPALCGLVAWLVCLATAYYLQRGRMRRLKYKAPVVTECPEGIARPYAQGSVYFRLQGTSRRLGGAQECSVWFWDQASCGLVLKEKRSRQTVLTIPWDTVTRGRIDVGDAITQRNPASIVMECRPILQGREGPVHTPMLVKLTLSSFSDLDNFRVLADALDLSRQPQLSWWLGEEVFLRWGFHKVITPMLLCEMTHLSLFVLMFCTKIAALSKLLQMADALDCKFNVWGTTGAHLPSPQSPMWVHFCTGLVMVAFWWPVHVIMIILTVVGSLLGLQIVVLFGHMRTDYALAHPSFETVESLLLLSGPLLGMVGKTIPGLLASVTKVFNYDMCDPMAPTIFKLLGLSLIVRAFRYHHRNLSQYVLGCIMDRSLCYSSFWERGRRNHDYRSDLYQLMASEHLAKRVPHEKREAKQKEHAANSEECTDADCACNGKDVGRHSRYAVESKKWVPCPRRTCVCADEEREYEYCGCTYQADLLISYLEANKGFSDWGDVLSSACYYRCHYVLTKVLKRWSSQSDIEAAVHVAARRGFTDILVRLHEHLPRSALPVRAGDGSTALHTAATHGHMDTVKRLLHNPLYGGLRDLTTSTDGRTALHCAAWAGQEALSMFLYRREPHVEEDSEAAEGRRLLHCAAAGGATELVTALLSNMGGAKLPVTDNGLTPLHYAAEKGKAGVLRILLAHERAALSAAAFAEELERVTSYGYTLLHCAATSSDCETVRVVIEAGAKVSARTPRRGDTALLIAVDRDHVSMVPLLAQADKTLCGMRSNDGRTVFHRARSVACLEALSALRAHGVTLPSLEELTRDRRSVLHCAAENGVYEVYKQLKAQLGGHVPAGHWTVLHSAVHGGHRKMVEWLLTFEKGTVDYHAMSNGETPLHVAVHEGHDNLVNMLVATPEGKECVNLSNNHCNTPLHLAAKRGSIISTEALLNADANVHARNKYGCTPLHLASMPVVAKMLLDKGANAHALAHSMTPLHLAAERGDRALVDLFLHAMKKGTQGHDLVSLAQSPLFYAVPSSNAQVVAHLCEWDRASVRRKTDRGGTVLHLAAKRSPPRVISLLCNADLHAVCDVDRVVMHDNAECEVTVGAGRHALNEACFPEPNIRTRDGMGQTPLHVAAEANRPDAMEALLRHRGLATKSILPYETYHYALRCQDVHGHTALHIAAKGGYANIVRQLCAAEARNCGDGRPGACEVLTDENGRTPLHLAVLHEHEHTVQALMDSCSAAAVQMVDNGGKTPGDLVRHSAANATILGHAHAGAAGGSAWVSQAMRNAYQSTLRVLGGKM